MEITGSNLHRQHDYCSIDLFTIDTTDYRKTNEDMARKTERELSVLLDTRLPLHTSPNK